jgi:hypothetical protein
MLNTIHKWNADTLDRFEAIIQQLRIDHTDPKFAPICDLVLSNIKIAKANINDVEYYGDDIEYIHLTNDQLKNIVNLLIPK